MPAKRKPQISNMIMMGDSLTDRGTLNKEFILGCIPMSLLSGLAGKSPRGRFTDGYTWDEYVSSMMSVELLIRQLKAEGKSPEDIADAVIEHRKQIEKQISESYNLDDDEAVKFEGQRFIRTYGEGGLTAHDYSWQPSYSIMRFFTRLIVSTLAHIRAQLFDDDRKQKVSPAQKAKTLVVEWSGANDLITVNEKPSLTEVESAVRARVKNAESMIKQGYRHFVLINLPDLSKTPRYQAKSASEQANAKACSEEFNRQLALAAKRLHTLYPQCSVEIFDVKKVFDEIYENPEKFGFDSGKRTASYTSLLDGKSPDAPKPKSKGYMFWDDVHPTSHMHALLANRFYTQFSAGYQLVAPDGVKQAPTPEVSADALFHAFFAKYREKWQGDKLGFFYQFRQMNIHFLQRLHEGTYEDRLANIFKHALFEGGDRTRDVLVKLRWLDKDGQLILNVPVLQDAMNKATRGMSYSP